jgi:hypothetical protein
MDIEKKDQRENSEENCAEEQPVRGKRPQDGDGHPAANESHKHAAWHSGKKYRGEKTFDH